MSPKLLSSREEDSSAGKRKLEVLVTHDCGECPYSGIERRGERSVVGIHVKVLPLDGQGMSQRVAFDGDAKLGQGG